MDENKLTEEQVDMIAEAMDQNLKSSENLQTIASLPSNNGVEEAVTKDKVETVIPETRKVLMNASNGNVSNEDVTDKDLITDEFDELVNRSMNSIENYDEENIDIEKEDIEKQLNASEYFSDLKLTTDDTLKLLEIVRRVQNKEKFNVFKELPNTIKDRLNKYFMSAGVGGYSVEVNTARNRIAESIIDEFISNISLDKFMIKSEEEMGKIQNKIDEMMSSMYLDYSSQRDKYISEVMDKQEDPKKKEAIGKILDSIHDGFELDRLKIAAGRIKIKKFDLEKPRRVFDLITSKYVNSTYNIYNPQLAHKVLIRHLVQENNLLTEEQVTKFCIALCKFCINYSVKIPEQHAFMYYAIYNTFLLDVYKGDIYNDYLDKYSKNIIDVVDILEHRKKAIFTSDTNIVEDKNGTHTETTNTIKIVDYNEE